MLRVVKHDIGHQSLPKYPLLKLRLVKVVASAKIHICPNLQRLAEIKHSLIRPRKNDQWSLVGQCDCCHLLMLSNADRAHPDLVFKLNQTLVHPFDVVNLLLWSIRRLRNLAIQNLILGIVGLEILCSLHGMAVSER